MSLPNAKQFTSGERLDLWAGIVLDQALHAPIDSDVVHAAPVIGRGAFWLATLALEIHIEQFHERVRAAMQPGLRIMAAEVVAAAEAEAR